MLPLEAKMNVEIRAEAFTIPQFIQIYPMARPTPYKLWKQGIGPRRTRIGRKILISRAAAEEWLREMEKRSA